MGESGYSGTYVQLLQEENALLKARVIELEKKLKLAEIDARALGGSLAKRSR